MADNSSPARRLLRALSSTRARALLTLGMVLGLGAMTTLAYWTDTATVTTGSFTSGTLNLKVDGNEGNPTAYSLTTFTAANLVPGESVAGSFAVQNTGNVDFTYTATGTATGALAPSLRFTVKTGATSSTTGSAGSRVGSCTGGTAQSSLLTYTGTAQTVAGTAQTVAAGGSQTFCVIATLDSGTALSEGGKTASASFVVTAKQLGAP
jgi:predicted ribosomally synthesized peptide with SipW-like signal peptide